METKIHRPPVDTKGAALYTGYAETYLTRLRCTGGGPVFIKQKKAGGAVRYDLDDLDTWLAAGKRKSTSDTREVA